MGKTSNASKYRWNRDHYVQVKVSVPPEIAQAFKEKCKTEGVSMASELSRFMSGMASESKAPKKSAPNIETRPQRRKTLSNLIQQIEALADAETDYRDRIPDNLRNSCKYEAADSAVAALENALDHLDNVYL